MPSASVLTDSITAQIAAKPATFRWPNPVSAEPKRVHIQIDADARLAAGAAAAARYFAESAGVEGKAATEFQTATAHACEQAFANMPSDDSHLDVFLLQFDDRVEVALSQEGDVEPAVSLQSLLGATPSTIQGVDRVQYEHIGGASVTRLTKFISRHS